MTAPKTNRVDDPPPICPVCGAIVEEIRPEMNWDGPEGGGSSMTGRCVRCDVDFRKFFGKIPVDWHLVAPSANDILAPVTDEELSAISNKLSRYSFHCGKWQAFLARRRPGDELWNVRSEPGMRQVAIVRDGKPVIGFGFGLPS